MDSQVQLDTKENRVKTVYQVHEEIADFLATKETGDKKANVDRKVIR